MDKEPKLTRLNEESKSSIYRKEGDYIYPLPTFITFARDEEPPHATHAKETYNNTQDGTPTNDLIDEEPYIPPKFE